jgi:2-keto-3-deoxy-L-rhamnonate aldolase RhmA
VRAEWPGASCPTIERTAHEPSFSRCSGTARSRVPRAWRRTLETTRSLRQRVLDGETLVGTFLILGSPAIAEICARGGFDWVLVDLEHGMVGDDHLLPVLLAITGRGAAALVRVESGARSRVGRALDLGAEGVMVPQVQSAEEAADVAGWLRYQPGGQRGIALFTRGMDYGSMGHAAVASRHEQLVGIVQVESRAALAAARDIAAIEGVDVLFVGPTDLSHSLGVPGRLDDRAFEEAIAEVAAAAREAGKAAGVFVWDPTDVPRYLALGYTFLALSSDGSIIERAMRSALADVRAAVASNAS